MFVRFVSLVLAGIAFAAPAFAQSTVAIVPGPAAAGATAPEPLTPLDILDTDYPLESLLANEEGMVQLVITVNEQGRVGARVREPSGKTRLEQQAIAIARSRWQFKPGMRNGAPVAASLNADVIWRMPLRPANDYYASMMGIPVTSKDVVAPKASESRPLAARDYPVASIRNHEQGDVALRLRIGADGKVEDVRMLDKSGSSRLDRAATELATGAYTYAPGTIEGKPASMTYDMMFSFRLGEGASQACHSIPILGLTVEMVPSGGLFVSQWMHVKPDGSVDDVLLRTQKGWMHFSTPMVQAVSAAAHIGAANRPSSQPPRTGSLFGTRQNARRESCWIKSDTTIKTN